MALHPYQIAEQLERERRRDRSWQPEPLHAPSPVAPPRRREEQPARDSGSRGGNVVIIDISSGEITRR